MDAGSSVTLRAYYVRDFAPLFLCGAAPRTFEAYEGTLSRWELHTPNPHLAAIDNRALATFKAALTTAPDITSGATVNKHLRHLRALLLAAGPPTPTNPEGLGLIAAVPFTRSLKLPEPEPHDVTDDVLAAFYTACARARLPDYDVTPSPWWRALCAAADAFAPK